MTQSHLQLRQQQYFKLSSAIALLNHDQLTGLLIENDGLSSWGQSQTISVADTQVFVKRIPLTVREFDTLFSTDNLYDLPNFYHYGFGSTGFGGSRELISHIRTTNWVLAGDIEAFPLMYHYRIVPYIGTRPKMDKAYHKRFLKYWGSDANIDQYALDRANASHELVMFLEHIPFTVGNWLLENPKRITQVVTDMRDAIRFLNVQGFLHLDIHFFNMVTDGRRSYLTDFGLALDRHFELAPAEYEFYAQHLDYDYGLLLWSLGYHLYWKYRQLDDEYQRAVQKICQCEADDSFEEMVAAMLEHLAELKPLTPLNIVPEFVELLERYRPVITHIHNFYVSMRRNNNKDTPFEHEKLHRLLLECGFIDAS